ncbi:YdcH family protein [Microvirga sp. GCM10011540]|uniref:YdcH family protein n=1 Tax=Microvirga sp. GCM10011540 TaxID=3317338 RepID=UPI003617124D
MSNAPNDLAGDFPDKTDRIHQLKTSNNHFARLYDEYNELNRTIHRVETRVEPTTEDVEEDLKRRRVRLKDELLAMIENEENA